MVLVRVTAYKNCDCFVFVCLQLPAECRYVDPAREARTRPVRLRAEYSLAGMMLDNCPKSCLTLHHLSDPHSKREGAHGVQSKSGIILPR